MQINYIYFNSAVDLAGSSCSLMQGNADAEPAMKMASVEEMHVPLPQITLYM